MAAKIAEKLKVNAAKEEKIRVEKLKEIELEELKKKQLLEDEEKRKNLVKNMESMIAPKKVEKLASKETDSDLKKEEKNVNEIEEIVRNNELEAGDIVVEEKVKGSAEPEKTMMTGDKIEK